MRAAIWSEFKTILLASIVAGLIWIYAEGESLSTRTVEINITLPSDPAGTLVLRPNDPNWKGVARVRLEGTTRTIDEAASLLSAGIKLTPGNPGVPAEPGTDRTVDLRDAISSQTEIRGLGSSVAEVDPPYLHVDVVRLASRELPIRVELGLDVPLDGDPVAQPATATIRLPEKYIAALPDAAALVAYVPADELRRLKTEGPQTVTAAVRPPAGLTQVSPMSISLETVAVKLRIRRKLESIKVPTVPVWFSLPPTEGGGKWTIDILDPFLTDVSLTGPSDDLERIRSGEQAVKAFVELSSDELERAVTSKSVVFRGLPPSIAAPSPTPSVRLRITRRDGSPPGSPTKP